MNGNEEPTGCARVRGRLDEYIDGGLDELSAARDGGHLEACAACALERERRILWLGKLQAALEPALAAQRHATAGLGARLAAARPPQSLGPLSTRSPGVRRAAWAAAAAACALLALALFQGWTAEPGEIESWMGASLHVFSGQALPDVSWSDDPLAPWLGR
jgi:anti-sigma factor RsiW